jgi:Ca2+:H+ antiporter
VGVPALRRARRGGPRAAGRRAAGPGRGPAGRLRGRRAFASDWFVGALEPAIDALGISAAFAGLVIVAIAGNAVENVVGIVLAAKGQADLAISVVKNSVAQVAVFLFPLLVLVSLLFAHHLTFQLEPVYVGALLLTALALWQITGDGEATVFEGAALIALYVTLGAFAWLD